jgi:beta-galactosidase
MNWTELEERPIGEGARLVMQSGVELPQWQSLGSKTVIPAPGNSVVRPVRGGHVEAKATRGRLAVVTVQTEAAAAALALKVDRASIAADGRDLAVVEVDVVDARGVVVPRASDTIDLTIEGPGTIAGVDNGNPTSHESYRGTSRSAFSGKALAIIQSTSSPGTITLKATSGSLAGSSVDIVTATP